MRALAIRVVSLLGLICLISWEVWKAGDMFSTLKEDQFAGGDIEKQFMKISLELEENELPAFSQAADIENAMMQRARKQNLVKHCHKRNRTEIYPAGQNQITGLNRAAFRNILVSDKNQLLYCMVPKVACSNWRRVLLVLEGYIQDPQALDSTDVHNNTFGLLRPLSDYSSDEIIFRLSTYYKFMFVRNPIERLTSAFRSKFVESRVAFFREVFGKYILERYRPDTPTDQATKGDGVTFRDFVQYVVDSPPEHPDYVNAHWERYDRLCLPCLIYYDYIGKFETMDDDADYLLRLIDAKSKVSLPRLKSNYRVPTKALSNFYFRSLSSDLQEKLVKTYKHDFEMFGYKKPTITHDKKRK
eukprot:gene6647-12188_t